MALQCRRCRSRSVIYDRSLGGRPICSVCGTPMSAARNTSGGRFSLFGGLSPAGGKKVVSVKSVIACLLPLGLVGSYLSMMANPRAVSHWLAPYSPSSANSWLIKMPADIELLIDQAQRADAEPVAPSTHGVIRDLITRLDAKGVRVLISERVVEGAGGVWDPGLAEVRIRPSMVAKGSSVLAEILAHEAAHVAQSCKAGGLGRSSEPMGIQVDPAEVFRYQLDSPLYAGPPSSKAIELEAFSVGANPPYAIKLLDHFCKR
jgi:hypothetical protein